MFFSVNLSRERAVYPTSKSILHQDIPLAQRFARLGSRPELQGEVGGRVDLFLRKFQNFLCAQVRLQIPIVEW